MAKRILLAEDSATMRKVVELTFAKGEYEVITVDTVDRAVAEVRRGVPDIFIADLSMEGKNGYDACAAVKSLASIPVLLLHGRLAPLDPLRARQVGADADLEKPFSTRAIIEKVETLLRTKPPSARLAVKPLSTPIENDDVLMEAEAGGASALDLPIPSMGAAAAGAPKAASPARPPQLGRAAVKAGERPPQRKRTDPGTGVVLPEPPRGMPPLGKVATRASALPPPPEIPVPSAADDDSLAVEIMIEAEPPPIEVRADASPPSAPEAISRPASAAGTIDTKRSTPPSAPETRPSRPPSRPVLPQRPKVAPVAQGRVAEVAKAAADAAGAALPAALDGMDPAVVEAIAALTREVVERVVWEVVPDLAETIIKEELERLIAARQE